MKFSEFLLEAKQKNFWESNRVICFRSEVYSLLFFRTLWSFLKEKKVFSITPLQINQSFDLSEVLQQSFLGETSFYWLGNVAESIKTKKKKNEPDEIEGLCSYQGPNAIAFFLAADHTVASEKQILLVDVPSVVSSLHMREVFSFFEESFSPQKMKIFNDLTARVGAIPLDTVCMLAHYLSVANIRFEDELKIRLDALVAPEMSLYTLSKLFFTKQKKKFFSLWATCQEAYTVPFWTVYWGEQLWRAYHVTKFLKQNNFPAARRFAFRLPPSFLKDDWRQCSLPELEKAYAMVYDIDFAFKVGSTFCSLDLLYSSYFLGKFPSDKSFGKI